MLFEPQHDGFKTVVRGKSTTKKANPAGPPRTNGGDEEVLARRIERHSTKRAIKPMLAKLKELNRLVVARG